MIQIMLIAPYQALADSFQEIASEFEGVNVDSCVGDLNEALLYFNLALHSKNYDAIISRGGTAMLVRENTSLPVIEVEVSLLDMLYGIKLVERTGRDFVIVGFRNITSSAKILADALGYELRIHEISDKESAMETLKEVTAKDSRVMVLGDTVTVGLASELGLDSLLIGSGRESIRKAIKDAVEMVGCIKRASAASALGSTMLGKLPCTVAAFNSAGHLAYLNHPVQGISVMYLTELLGGCLDEVRKCGTMRFRKRIKAQRLDITAEYIQSSAEGCMTVFYIDSSACFTAKSMQGLLTEENAEDVQKKEDPGLYPPSYFREYLEQADAVLASGKPLVVYGEAGTGKDSFVNNIYLKKFRGRSPLVTIYCPMLSEKNWNVLVRDTNSPLYGENTVIFFKSIHALSVEMQRKLDLFLSETNLLGRNYVVSSARHKLADMVVSGQFVQSLYMKLDTTSIFLPPLRERRDEIVAIASHFLGAYNTLYSKHILGFRDEAIPLLLGHSWRLNIEELRQTVKKLVISLEQSYIPAEAVRAVLLSLSNDRSELLPIDLSKTMEEIELDIINYVLRSENMSHSQAAARLGISRSTIWRKLGGSSGPGKPKE